VSVRTSIKPHRTHRHTRHTAVDDTNPQVTAPSGDLSGALPRTGWKKSSLALITDSHDFHE